MSRDVRRQETLRDQGPASSDTKGSGDAEVEPTAEMTISVQPVAAETYYPPELLDFPLFLDMELSKKVLHRLTKACWGLMTSIAFWLMIFNMDLFVFATNLILPLRHVIDEPDARQVRSHGSRQRWKSSHPRRYEQRRRGREVVPASFSPSQPPPFLHAPVTFLLCHAAYLVGVKSRYCPDWLRWWSTWCGRGYEGKWGEPSWPEENDSRGPCPALNAMANHGILPTDGRSITPHQLAAAVARTFNLSPSLAIKITWIGRELWEDRGEFDLADLAAHNVFEHDASLFRPDTHSPEQVQDPQAQSHPWPSLVDALLPTPEVWDAMRADTEEARARRYWEISTVDHRGQARISLANLSQALSARRIQCAKENGQYTQSIEIKMRGSLKAVLFHSTFGGRIVDMRSLAGGNYYGHSGSKHARQERYFAGLEHLPLYPWQPHNRQYYGKSAIGNLLRGLFVEMATDPISVPRQVEDRTEEYAASISAGETIIAELVETEPAEQEAEAAPGSDDTLHEASTGPERTAPQPKTKGVTFDIREPLSELGIAPT